MNYMELFLNIYFYNFCLLDRALGSVAGRTGTQVYIPKDLQKADGNNIIRHTSKTEKIK